MTTFEDLAVLVSIIVGLGITHLLGGVARFIHHPDRYKFYWVHLVWIWYVFLMLLFFWWVQLWMNTVEEWNSHLYTFLVLYSVILYLICVIITPPDSPEGLDLREFFFSKRKWFFGGLLALCPLDIVDSLIKDYPIPFLVCRCPSDHRGHADQKHKIPRGNCSILLPRVHGLSATRRVGPIRSGVTDIWEFLAPTIPTTHDSPWWLAGLGRAVDSPRRKLDEGP